MNNPLFLDLPKKRTRKLEISLQKNVPIFGCNKCYTY